MTNQEAINVLFNEWKCIDRNDGIHCDRKCESCDLIMDVGIIREAFNKAIFALQAQEAKTQLSAEGTTSDLISRQAAINALVKAIRKDPYYDSNEAINGLGVCDVRVILNDLPSAEPEIIHCRECQHHRRDNTGCYYCVRKEYGYGWGLNDFCSDAERRTDGSD